MNKILSCLFPATLLSVVFTLPASATHLTEHVNIPGSTYILGSTENGDGLWCHGCINSQKWIHIDRDEMMTLGQGTSVSAAGGKFAILRTDMGMSCPAGSIAVLNLETGKYVGPEVDECNDLKVDYKIANGKWWVKVRNHMYSGK